MKQRKVSILLLLFSLFNISYSLPDGFRTELIHVNAGDSYTGIEILNHMVHRSRNRARFLAGRTPIGNVTVPSFPSSSDNMVIHNEYLINISIGTPPQHFVLTLDTGSDLVWTQCKPLVHSFKQPYPFFDPKSSSSFSNTSCQVQLCIEAPDGGCTKDKLCNFNSTYGDGSYTSGLLGKETFTLGSTQVTDMYFGCGNDNVGVFFSNECGIAGFGRGNLSLVSQLGYDKFAYCFTSFGQFKFSPVLFGSLADSNGFKNVTIVSTPFFPNPELYPSFYYLTLNGITVGTKLLNISTSTFAVKSDGSGGVIIDSGSAITSFPQKVYDTVKSEFKAQVKLPLLVRDNLDCFNLSSTSPENFVPPKFIFHFAGADLELPPENYMEKYVDKKLACLAMSGDSDPMTIIGNFQQQNILVVYDLARKKLSFAHAQCDHF